MLSPLLISMRPRQWIKNAFVLPALVFSQHLFTPSFVALALAAVACFCVISSAVYLVNDVADADQDSRHPVKCRRPIAAGILDKRVALGWAAGLLAAGLAGAFLLNAGFGLIALVYAGINLAYSFRLKRVVLLDIILVATGFLLRAVGGAVAIGVPMSPWFIVCIFSLALFLAAVKRRQEIVTLAGQAREHRAILDEYSLPFLDQVIAIFTSATLVCYALYAIGLGAAGEGTGRSMQWSIPFVLYGILRYLYLVYRTGAGESPTQVIWTDRPLQVDMLLWLVVSVLVYYGM